VKNGFVVVAFVHVVQKVFRALGRFVSIEFDGDNAVFQDVQFDLWVAHGVFP
jgi:hypothetical protein